MSPVSPPTSGGIAAYAAHRKALGLPGGTHRAVRRAIDAERIERSVRHVDGAVLIDFELADREWAARTDASRAPVSVRERQAPAWPFRILVLRDLELVEVAYDDPEPADENGLTDSFCIGLEPSDARRLGEELIAAARRAVR